MKRVGADERIGHGTKVVDFDVDVLDLLEVFEHDETWRPRGEAAWVLAPPEWVDALPFDEDEEDVLTKERGIGFIVDLLVGE